MIPDLEISIAPSRSGRPRRGRRAAGYSLVEVLIASALLLVITVAVVPLFTRALESNVAGGRATVMSTFAAQDIESANQSTVDHPDLDLPVGNDVLDLGTDYWATSATGRTGDQFWKDNDSPGDGLILWERSTKVRKYSFADVLPGLISVDTGTDLVPLGHPELFDSPLDNDDGAAATNVHIIEFRVTMKHRGEASMGGEQKMTVGHFRSY